jgi:hydroxyacylglutathione hydrolase
MMAGLSSGATVVDTRGTTAFAAGHIPGTINIPLNKSFSTWAGSIVPYDRDLYLIVDGDVEARALEAARDLAMIGLDRVAGYVGAEALAAWQGKGKLATIPQIGAAELARRLSKGEATVIDVRNASEWDTGHVSGASNVPLATLAERIAEIPRDQQVVVHCQAGTRSSIAASVLRANGVENVVNLTGGFAEWSDTGLPIETEPR